MGIPFWLSYGGLWCLVVVQALALLELIRQVGYLRTIAGPQQGAAIVDAVERGTALPELVGTRLGSADRATWSDFISTEFGAIVFLTTHCVTCREVAEELTGFERDLPDNVSLMVIMEGEESTVEKFARAGRLDSRFVCVDEAGETGKRIGVTWTPAALTVRNGKIGRSGIVNNVFQISSFINEELARDEEDDREAAVSRDLFESIRRMTDGGSETGIDEPRAASPLSKGR
jgi:hypothetical protein